MLTNSIEATIALAGNPNSGKTTLFNALTGARQHVGNYPGITVEKKIGAYIKNNRRFTIVDLPGTYSLTAYSLEEIVARDFLVQEKPAVVVDIVDAANLERNLYLSIQLLEMGLPVCIALNMVDAAQRRGIKIDEKRLAEMLNVPVIPTIARSGRGKDALMQAAEEIANSHITRSPLLISYGQDIDQALFEMERLIRDEQFLTDTDLPRWIALKYMEADENMRERGKHRNPALSSKLDSIVGHVSDHLEETLGTDPEAMIADHRYGYIRSIVNQGVITRGSDLSQLHVSDRLDGIITHRFLGPLIMVAVLFGLYQFTFAYSAVPVAWLETGLSELSQLAAVHLPEGMLKSLVISAVINGVGGVLGFVPLIVFMFFGIAILEDSGYLARVAFMLDRIFRVFGLHGSSVMPFIISGGIAGGCAVPGVMAARTLKSPTGETRDNSDRSVHELWGQASGFCIARGHLLRPIRSVDDVRHHPGGLGGRPSGSQTAAHNGHPGRGHTVCHGIAALPSAHAEGGRHPYLGENLAVHQKGRHHYTGHIDYHVGPDEFSRASGQHQTGFPGRATGTADRGRRAGVPRDSVRKRPW